MFMGLSVDDLMEYTDWERGKWHEWLHGHGDQVLAISAGPHGDGRFQSIGDMIKHIFSAEKRYCERLTNRPLTNPATIPSDNVERLFEFSRQSRQGLRELLAAFPERDWDVVQELRFPAPLNAFARVTPRKIVMHILMHEIRHWAQIGTLFRLNGLVDEFHDFIVSPVMGGEFGRIAQP